ncbi:hypothetical protein B0I26_101478 [Anoxybacillus vitaminiphilus]|jgi:hypothetical protein|uniref:Prolyl oligopeptidase family protein n=1 Tax=Paranoxybacillus vitaminiphilus TaxID=581036 RepID=A0A327YT32_9BACL|nr:hypothetical protein [Anoxybacillus vitaminiphilus]RAK23516.1 hypothetical protein B0I26_101478 [Anoxybacillus vitaminiphilus]
MQLFATRKIRNVPGCIIAGRKDKFYDNIEKLCRLFAHHRIQYELYVDEQEGHMFPRQFHKLLMEAIHFIKIKG